MTDTVATSRGGMCSNPFGGEERIDRINLLDHLGSNAPSQRVLYSCVIQDAASNYLYALLGKNGTSVQEFFAAHQYFFRITSVDKESWGSRKVKKSYTQRGKKVLETHHLTDDEVMLMCFDKHYEFSGMEQHLCIEKFRIQLMDKRRRIVTNNWPQISSYVNGLYQKELSEIVPGSQVPMQVWQERLQEILIDPRDPYQLASLLYVPAKLKRSRKATKKKQLDGRFADLAKRLSLKQIEPLQSDWGPIAILTGG